MRKWNCKRMARMMARYVGGDLADAGERKARVHLAACEKCRRLAEEFYESSTLLVESSVLPEFTPEFYAGIRSSVMGQISSGGGHPRPSLFWRRWVYATSLAVAIAVAIIVSLLILQYHRLAPAGPRSSAFNPTTANLGSSTSGSVAVLPSLPELAGWPRPRPKPGRVTVRTARGDAGESARAMPTSTSAGSVAEVRENRAFNNLPGETAASGLAAIPAREVTRIEIRTADPNIRIIWLAPRQSEGSKGIESDPYQDQNADRQ
jgi:hypothetical protein